MIKEIREQMLAQPRLGTPAAELTQSEQGAIAFCAGVPFALRFMEHGLLMESLAPFAIVGSAGGRLQSDPPHPQRVQWCK